jgi:hypothetical protein
MTKATADVHVRVKGIIYEGQYPVPYQVSHNNDTDRHVNDPIAQGVIGRRRSLRNLQGSHCKSYEEST